MPSTPDRRDAEPLPDLPTLGTRLRWARQRAALKQADLAQQVGKKQQYISGVEHDRIESPARAVLAALARVLGVSPLWLLAGTAAALTADEHTLLEDYRPLGDRERALVRVVLQELHRWPPLPERQAMPLSESALWLARHWEQLSPAGQAAVQATLQSFLPPPER